MSHGLVVLQVLQARPDLAESFFSLDICGDSFSRKEIWSFETLPVPIAASLPSNQSNRELWSP
jgi:hypothetical protein